MTKTKKRVAITLISIFLLPILIFFILGICAILDGYGAFENYSGWERVDIPTESELTATIKLPKEWKFVIENDRIKIKDVDGNVIATECYEGWRIDYDKGGVHYDNNDEMDVNPELPDYYRDLENYEFVKGASSACFLHKITYESTTNYALCMDIMDKKSVEGTYCLFIVFDSKFDNMTLYDKLQKSYLYGGYIKE